MQIETKARQAGAVLSWHLAPRAETTTVTFSGEIDENADFSELRRSISGHVTFHLGGIRRINSCGVREWVNFVRDLPNVTTLVFTHCSPAIVTQLNMIYNFRGDATIRSFYAPYVCEACNMESDKLLDVASQFGEGARAEVPAFSCERCGEPMDFDDLPERYLSFLMEA